MPEKQFLVEKPGEKIGSEGAGEGDGNPCQDHCRDHDNGDLDCLKGADQDPARTDLGVGEHFAFAKTEGEQEYEELSATTIRKSRFLPNKCVINHLPLR